MMTSIFEQLVEKESNFVCITVAGIQSAQSETANKRW